MGGAGGVGVAGVKLDWGDEGARLWGELGGELTGCGLIGCGLICCWKEL